MTLAAAFRGPKGGILLCSDQEWNDGGVSKREINKNYRISGLLQCDIFISGSGPDSSVIKAWHEIHEVILKAVNDGKDILANHKELISTALASVHSQYGETLIAWPLALLIVIAPRANDRVPMLYKTEGSVLIDAPYYCAVGAGKPIADYFSNRLYECPWMRSKRELVTLVAFIMREASESVPGVGMGANIVFVNESEKAMHFMGPGVVKEIQDGIPSLSDAIQNYWPGKINFPDWMGS